MARSTFKVLFYVNGSKEKNGIVPIMGRVTINGTVAQFSCKQSIPKTLWDVKGNKAKGKSREARDINLALDKSRRKSSSTTSAFPTVRHSSRRKWCAMPIRVSAWNTRLCSRLLTRKMRYSKSVWGKYRVMATYRSRVVARNYVAAFIKSFYKRNDMSMLELTPDFIKEFAAYLSTEAGLHNGTIWEKCMWLKGVVMRAHFNGLIPRNPFAQFHISPNVKEREFLTEDELKVLMTHDSEDSKLAYIRDIFIFASFTALSFVDVQELTNDNIVEVKGEKWILSKCHKTKVPFQVKLLDIPLQIIERYRPMQKENLIFPGLNYWSICKPLKKMIKECGINKDISFHCARHGFATLALCKGMPIESVSRVLGHTNIVTTQIYAKITTQKLDNDLTMFGNKLSKAFNGITMA